MKIPGYRYLVDVIFPDLKKKLPKLTESVKFTGFDPETGLYIDDITEDFILVRLNSTSVQFSYEEMLLDKRLRKILNYLLMWYNMMKYDGYIITTTGRPDQEFVLSVSGKKFGYNVVFKTGISNLGSRANRGIDIEPLLLSSMPLVTKQREYFRGERI